MHGAVAERGEPKNGQRNRRGKGWRGRKGSLSFVTSSVPTPNARWTCVCRRCPCKSHTRVCIGKGQPLVTSGSRTPSPPPLAAAHVADEPEGHAESRSLAHVLVQLLLPYTEAVHSLCACVIKLLGWQYYALACLG